MQYQQVSVRRKSGAALVQHLIPQSRYHLRQETRDRNEYTKHLNTWDCSLSVHQLKWNSGCLFKLLLQTGNTEIHLINQCTLLPASSNFYMIENTERLIWAGDFVRSLDHTKGFIEKNRCQKINKLECNLRDLSDVVMDLISLETLLPYASITWWSKYWKKKSMRFIKSILTIGLPLGNFQLFSQNIVVCILGSGGKILNLCSGKTKKKMIFSDAINELKEA